MTGIVYCSTHGQFYPCPTCEAQRMAEDRDAAMSQRAEGVDLSAGDPPSQPHFVASAWLAIAACIGLASWAAVVWGALKMWGLMP